MAISIIEALWVDVCPASAILPFTGVAALVEGEQVAIFRLASECCAISNYDPFSKAYVMSRGLVGDKGGVIKVASPIYKNTFNLLTGQCFEDEKVRLRTWAVRVVDGIVQIAI
jgi:nitrite reductase (NADH) small subunit